MLNDLMLFVNQYFPLFVVIAILLYSIIMMVAIVKIIKVELCKRKIIKVIKDKEITKDSIDVLLQYYNISNIYINRMLIEIRFKFEFTSTSNTNLDRKEDIMHNLAKLEVEYKNEYQYSGIPIELKKELIKIKKNQPSGYENFDKLVNLISNTCKKQTKWNIFSNVSGIVGTIVGIASVVMFFL